MIESLKKIFKSNNIAFNEITNDLISIENFLTDQELEFILSKISAASQEDWEVEYTNNLKNFCMTKFGRDDVDNLVAEGKFEVTQNWADKNLSIGQLPPIRVFTEKLNSFVKEANPDLELSGFSTIQRMQPGVDLKAHTDDHTDPSIEYAAIIYLNDDYVDGELFFKKLDLKVKPKPKTLLIFPGNEKYEHGVMPVSDGPIRYVLVGFIKKDGFYKENRY